LLCPTVFDVFGLCLPLSICSNCNDGFCQLKIIANILEAAAMIEAARPKTGNSAKLAKQLTGEDYMLTPCKSKPKTLLKLLSAKT
jgi:hypothetical protein